jgi:hypothetical protein
MNMETAITKKVLSTILIFSFLLWTSGCYNLIEVKPSAAEVNKNIDIKTKDGVTYLLTEWQLLPNGDVKGKGTKTFIDKEKEVSLPFDGTIPAKDIQIVTQKESLNNGIMILSVLVIVGIIVIIMQPIGDMHI